MTEPQAVAVPAELQQQSESLTVRAKSLQPITTAEQYTDAVGIGRSLRAMEEGIKDFWSPLVQAAHAQHKALVQRRESMLAAVFLALEHVKDLIVDYDKKQEAIRQAAERAAEAALKKQADDNALAAAANLEAAGDSHGAAAVLSQQMNAPAPAVVVQSTVPKVAGKSSRENWTFRIVNEGLLPREYLTPDLQAITRVVKAMKSKTKIPGVQVMNEPGVSLRR